MRQKEKIQDISINTMQTLMFAKAQVPDVAETPLL